MLFEILIFRAHIGSIMIRASPGATFKQIRDLICAYLEIDSKKLKLYGIERMDFFHDNMTVDTKYISPRERILAIVWEQTEYT